MLAHSPRASSGCRDGIQFNYDKHCKQEEEIHDKVARPACLGAVWYVWQGAASPVVVKGGEWRGRLVEVRKQAVKTPLGAGYCCLS